MAEKTVKTVKTKIKMPDGSFEYMSHPDNWTDSQMDAAVSEMQASNPDQSPKEKPNVSSDIINSISNAPGAILDFVSNLPGQIVEGAGELAQHPVRGTGELAAGLLQGLKGGANIPSNIASYMQSRDVGDEHKELRDLIAKAHIPDTG